MQQKQDAIEVATVLQRKLSNKLELKIKRIEKYQPKAKGEADESGGLPIDSFASQKHQDDKDVN